MKIYNATNVPGPIAGTLPFVDGEMGLFFPENNNQPEPRFLTFDEDHIHALCDSWEPNAVVCLDMEGSTRSGSEDNGLQRWLHHLHPEDSVRLRWEIYRICKTRRPDCDFGLWGIPGSWNDTVYQYQWKDVAENAQRELDYLWLGTLSDSLYISAYWSFGTDTEDDDSFMGDWVKRLERRFHAADLYYNRSDVKVFVCPFMPNRLGGKRVDNAILAQQFNYLNDRDIETVFWMPNAQTELDDGLRWALQWYGDV